MSKVLGDKKALALFTIPALLLFTILVFIPIIWSLVYTFFTGTPGVNFTDRKSSCRERVSSPV